MTHFDLEKHVENVKFILEKRNVPQITAEVVAILDVSGSTKNLYLGGTIQKALQCIVPIAMIFDDNQDLPVYVFSDGANFKAVGTHLTPKNYSDYVQKHILNDSSLPLWGGTDYAPVLHAALADLGFYHSSHKTDTRSFFKRMVGSEDPIISEGFNQNSLSGLPAMINFITDGENSRDDRRHTDELLKAASLAKCEVYFNFIGVGTANLSYLQQIADAYPNTGFAQIKDIEATAGTDEIYQYLLPDELTEWLKISASAKVGSRP